MNTSEVHHQQVNNNKIEHLSHIKTRDINLLKTHQVHSHFYQFNKINSSCMVPTLTITQVNKTFQFRMHTILEEPEQSSGDLKFIKIQNYF